MDPSQVFVGRVKSIKPSFGFIAREGSAGDVFLHKSELLEPGIKVGSVVQFTTKAGAKGPNACGIRMAPKPGNGEVCRLLLNPLTYYDSKP